MNIEHWTFCAPGRFNQIQENLYTYTFTFFFLTIYQRTLKWNQILWKLFFRKDDRLFIIFTSWWYLHNRLQTTFALSYEREEAQWNGVWIYGLQEEFDRWCVQYGNDGSNEIEDGCVINTSGDITKMVFKYCFHTSFGVPPMIALAHT